MPDVRDLINQAKQGAANGVRLAFRYNGQPRVVEVRDYRIGLQGDLQILSYQGAGGSNSGGIPDWRRFRINKIQGANLIDPNANRAAPGSMAAHVPAGTRTFKPTRVVAVRKKGTL